MKHGHSSAHDSAVSHVTGQSQYVDDRQMLKNELLVGYVTAKVACGKIQNIDFSKALKVPGVVCVLTASDLAHNNWGTIVQDQPLLAQSQVEYFDEPVAIVAAESEQALSLAKKMILVEIQALPAVLTIQEAVNKKMFLSVAEPFIKGDFNQAMAVAPHKLKGELSLGGQEHFYMENQAAVVYSSENGHFEVHSSTQHPTETQHVVAKALGIEFHKVTCIVKRLGGGFGGKESQAAPMAAMAALVAQKTGRAARMVLTKDEDMKITGKRHPFWHRYEIGFDENGKIQAARFELYADGGAYTDLSPSILERAMFHVDGAYYLPNVEIYAACCKTNTYSNTAFRGFGGPQGTFLIESLLEDIAVFLKKDSFDIRTLNSYQGDRNLTPYGQKIEQNPLPEIFSKLRKSSDYDSRRQEILKFNSKDKFKLRGLSMTATKFGIAFTARFLNQGNALVNLHVDGTAQVSTGAVEMGQGVNTKICQLVAEVFGIDSKKISVMTTSTEKNANTSPTAASSGADINGAAAVKAAQAIRQRLARLAEMYFAGQTFDALNEYQLSQSAENLSHFIFKEGQVHCTRTNQKIIFSDLLKKAHLNRISLSEYAHFKTEGLGFDKKTITGTPFKYFTFGAAVTEVEIDRFTGESKVLRTDILMDLGRSLNPAIDRGQTTGAFVQGLGWVLLEKLYHNTSGELLSHSPTTYKIPNVQDTPRIFNVDFIEAYKAEGVGIGAKAVGEPPFLLGISCWTAVKNALAGLESSRRPDFSSPATGEVILFEIERLKSESSL